MQLDDRFHSLRMTGRKSLARRGWNKKVRMQVPSDLRHLHSPLVWSYQEEEIPRDSPLLAWWIHRTFPNANRPGHWKKYPAGFERCQFEH